MAAGRLLAVTLALLLVPAALGRLQSTDPLGPGEHRGAGAAADPEPTEYQKAMLQGAQLERAGLFWPTSVLEGVSRGRTGGAALLNALLPGLTGEDPDWGQEVGQASGGPGGAGVGLRGGAGRGGRRRHLQTAAPWRFFGVDVAFNSGPTLGALNSSFFRYDSVVADPVGLDWRLTPYMTPVQVQFDCASCWAMAAADTVAMVTAIATKSTPLGASTQQICDCGGKSCCGGGWPEDAFAYMLSQGNITAAADYNYWAQDGRQCSIPPAARVAGAITGWERVPAYSQDALIKAVNMQPVLVYISSSSPDFQTYSSPPPSRGVKVYNGNCSLEVNHAMVVVGYNLTQGYWVLKNTWPADGWGDSGFMYLAMSDGAGKCGMLTMSPIYPVYFPNAPNPVTVAPGSGSPVLKWGSTFWWNTWSPSNSSANPCAGIINPCGSGTCVGVGGIARCLCPAGYVEVTGVPTSKCVDPSPCSNSLVSPCGAGTCTDVGDGSYLCGCPQGYAIGFRVDGAPTCVPLTSVLARTIVAQYGDTCTRLRTLYAVPANTFYTLNPFLDCTKPLVPGVVVTLTASAGVPCTQTYALRTGDTCAALAYALSRKQLLNWLKTGPSLASVPPLSTLLPGPKKWNPSSQDLSGLLALNPALNCSLLMGSQQVCVSAAQNDTTDDDALDCGVTYTTADGDTCKSVATAFGLKLKVFSQLNPGFDCSQKNKPMGAGLEICVADASAKPAINCTTFYSVQQGDSCANIWNAANLSQAQFKYINPGLLCQAPYLYTGRQLCINSPVLANIADPGYLLYTVQPNDTWGWVQAQFSRKCLAWSITLDRIAAQNGIPDWTNYTLSANTSLVIPCVSGIGATCGCAPSLPVCGANNINYPSFCDAQCNFALPITNGACSACQAACAGRMGTSPSPASACTAGYRCPWPTWPPPLSYAQQVYTSSPLCSYRAQTCLRVCTMYSVNFGSSANTTCYNSCTACNRVPCSGPAEILALGTSPCFTCEAGNTADGCNPYGRACVTDCQYWNSFWNPLNP